MAYKIKSKTKRKAKSEYVVTFNERNKYHFKSKKEAEKFLNPKDDKIIWDYKMEY
jgi:hypothetical protein